VNAHVLGNRRDGPAELFEEPREITRVPRRASLQYAEQSRPRKPAGYPVAMPRYEFRCRECAGLGTTSVFEVSRPMSAAGDPAACPAGHSDTVKLLSTVAVTGSATPVSAGRSGGGCCGGGCGCG
jgi:putative FmdB family regulatory protein